MITETTAAGTEVIRLSDEEYAAYMDAEVQASLGISAAEFQKQLAAGTVDWDNPDSFYVASVLGLAVNGALA